MTSPVRTSSLAPLRVARCPFYRLRYARKPRRQARLPRVLLGESRLSNRASEHRQGPVVALPRATRSVMPVHAAGVCQVWYTIIYRGITHAANRC